MELQLSAEEAALIERVLRQFVSELKPEITGTENYEWRQAMKQDEAMAKNLLERLHARQEPAADEVIILGEATVTIVSERPDS